MADDELSSTGKQPQEKATDPEDRTADHVVEYESRETRAAKASGGFLAIYKPGQGYWTRMGTVVGVGLIGVLTAHFLWQYLPVWMPLKEVLKPDQATGALVPVLEQRTGLVMGILAAFLAVYGAVAYWILNKPTVVDFLIATESEMKKVNWTTRKELLGSTKVVILFMFLIAAILFTIDIGFSLLFWSMGVLRVLPFGS